MRRALITAAVLAFSLSAAGAGSALAAAPCKDAKGKFIKCAPPAPAKPVRCKDAKGKFARCDAPGAHPA